MPRSRSLSSMKTLPFLLALPAIGLVAACGNLADSEPDEGPSGAPAARIDGGSGTTDTSDASTPRIAPPVLPDASMPDVGPKPLSWTWENPNYQGDDVQAIWPGGANDVWFAAGRYADKQRTVTSGSVLHWNGSDYATATAPPGWTSSVWGSSTTDVWAAGFVSGLQHFDGFTWKPATSPLAAKITRVWGFGPNDVWAIDTDGGVDHFDGTSWTQQKVVKPGMKPAAVYGAAPNDVWVAADFGLNTPTTFYRWNGATWTAVPAGVPYLQVTSMSGTGVNDIWAGGSQGLVHWNGTAWEGRTPPGAMHAPGVWAASANDVWVASGRAEIDHWDGTTWTKLDPGLRGSRLLTVQGRSAGDVWIGGTGGSIAHFDGASWTPVQNRPRADLYGGFASSETSAWVVGSGGTILHSTGDGTWSSAVSPVTAVLTEVHGTSDSDVWAVGKAGTILHYDGASWSTTTSGTTTNLTAVRALGAANAWAVGDDGVILHWDGTSWTSTPSGTTEKLSTVWGADPSDVWVGGLRTLLHWDGTSWTSQSPTPGKNWFSNIVGTSASDVWAVGATTLTINGTTYKNVDPAVAYHWDGATWSSASFGLGAAPFSVWIEKPGTFWTLDYEAQLMWTDGTTTPRYSFPATGLLQIFGSGSQKWAIGQFGSILRLH
jgi:hypothetical protein